MKILLVDDSADILNILASLLEVSGYESDQALNGTEAIKLLQHNVYDVVITDSEMPGMDGKALCRFIRSELPDLYIIGISGSTQSLDKLRAAGANICFLKPFRIDEIERAIEDRFRIWPAPPVVSDIPMGAKDAPRLSGHFGTSAYR